MESQKKRKDSGTVFTGETLKRFRAERFIQHVICPICVHRGNGILERMMKTVNIRLRRKRHIIVQRDSNEISKILFARRSEKRTDGKSAFEKQTGRQPNTLKLDNEARIGQKERDNEAKPAK